MLDPLPIIPFTKPASATVRLPGSKSITNRALLLAALADGETLLTGALFSEDTEIMIESLHRLGFDVEGDEKAETIRIRGEGGRIPNKKASLSIGNAGTAARFLTAFCCLADGGTYEMDGVPAMRKRPMKGLLDALAAWGAKIESNDGFFPIRIHANGLRGGLLEIDAAASSQLLSALLMVAPLTENESRFSFQNLRLPFVRMTLKMMAHFGQNEPEIVLSDSNSGEITVAKGAYQTVPNGIYDVEADVSAASYFAALPIATKGSITIENLPNPEESLQGDAAFFNILKKLGGKITPAETGGMRFEFFGTKDDVSIDDNFSQFSDTFLTLAALSPLLSQPTSIHGVAHSRRQETDRIAGMTQELRKLGQDVEEREDGLTVVPKIENLKKSEIHEVDTYGDHRFAMSLALLGSYDLHGDGRSWLAIRDPGCCVKTFPKFFEVLESAHKQSHQSETA